MSVYFLAQISIHDHAEYRKYLDECDEIFTRYNGEYLAVDDRPVILEGRWDPARVVLIRFPSEDDFRRWYESEEYQRILQHRLKAANCTSLLLRENEDLQDE